MSNKAKDKHVLVLGGYGTFGSRIVKALCQKGFKVTINGRHFHQAQELKHRILKKNLKAQVKVSCFDASEQLAVHLSKLKPDLVIHTCGPFQQQNSQIAQTILKAGIHYVDLADSRDYVQHMMTLGQSAKDRGITAITAASTVPALSSAVLSHLKKTLQIHTFKTVKIGISPGQRTPRGIATTQAVLSYLGRPMRPWTGMKQKKYGWFDTYLQPYPNLNDRLMSNCEAPDLDWLPNHFQIETLQFSAGMESKLLHRCIGILAGLIRLGLPIKPQRYAAALLKTSRWFDRFGTHDGGMHVAIDATTQTGEPIKKTWFIEAFQNHGPQIPAIPAILMAEKILTIDYPTGMLPCVDLITLDEYLNELKGLDIQTITV